MTEKRVYDVINKAEPRGQSVTYNGIPCTARTCVTRLNRLTEENEQLKKELEDALLDVKIYKNANATFDNVYQENNKLKSRIEYLERKIQRERNSTQKQYAKWEKEAETKIKELSGENEQLKKELRNLRRLANEIYMGGSE